MSSLKLKPQRSTRSFVGVVTLWVTVALGLAAHGSLHDPTDPTTLQTGVLGDWGTYVGAFMAQYVVSSVIQGLLGRQPDMMGSWGTYCSLNLMYLPGVVAGGDQGHQPQPPWGHNGDMVGMWLSFAEPQLHSLLRAGAQRCQHQLLGCGCPCHPDRDPAVAGAAAATHPSRQMEDFTLVLAMAFLQYSIWGQAQGRCWGAWQLVPPRAAPTPRPTHLSLVVIHVLGLQETHGAG